MSPIDVFTSALTSLASNKLRASLTLLGIVIGIMAVIVLISLGRGVQASITSQFEGLGANLITVTPGSGEGGFGAFFGEGGDVNTLTLSDAEALTEPGAAPSVAAVAPEINTWARVVYGNQNDGAQVLGVTQAYKDVRNYAVATGEFISDIHVRDGAAVTVLGADISESLFGLRNPVGQTVKLNGKPFTIIGVLEKQEGSFFGFLDQNLMVPLTTANDRLVGERTSTGDVPVNTINVQATSVEDINAAEQEIASILRLRHRITGSDDFTITAQQDAIAAINDATGVFVVFLGSIAAISLLVGGIGIMNIMFVTVTERTREIGIRKAMGAKRRDIMFQFLTEASLLSFGGGLVGFALGSMIALGLNGQELGDGVALDIAIGWDIATLAVLVSVGIGLFFGIYPAMRAARLHPIDALRYE